MLTTQVHCPRCSGVNAMNGVPSGVAARCPECGTLAGMDGTPTEWRPRDVILGLYEVKALLGEGGMGKVHRVYHLGWKIDLAVKSLRPELLARRGGAEDFEREAETWVKLGLHPHVVSCHYVRRLGGQPRVFVECMEGGSLKDWIERGRLYEGGPHRALEWMLDVAIQFARGLHHAHEQGLVHQDIKPDNVLMTPDGTAKVTDFGLAKARAAAGEAASGGHPGTIQVSYGGMTPAYCSPEQAAREAVSRRTDIWSWAVSVLEMFTGEVTWSSGSVAGEALEEYLSEGAPQGPIPPMPTTVAALLRQCFQIDPAARPKSMQAAAAALQAAFGEATGREYPRPEPRAADLLADERNNQAVSLLDLGRHSDAEACWQAALEADPQHPRATYNRGLYLWRAGRMRTAELFKAVREVQVAHSDDPGVKTLLARVYLDAGAFDRALEQVVGAGDLTSYPELESALREARDRSTDAGRCTLTIKGPRAVSAAALSADGRIAISGHEHKQGKDTGDSLCIWDAATGDSLRTLPCRAFVNSVALSADGKWALSAVVGPSMWEISTKAVGPARPPSGQQLQFWDTASGRCVRAFGPEGAEIRSIALSPDGLRALSGDSDGAACLWDTATGSCLRTFEGDHDCVQAVALSADGRWAFTASGSSFNPSQEDATLHLWEVATGRLAWVFERFTPHTSAVSLSADGKRALTGGEEYTAWLWDAHAGRRLRIFEGHSDGVISVCLSADGRRALTGSADGTVRLWDADTGRCLRVFEGHTKNVTAVALNAAGDLALSGSRDKLLKRWALPTNYRPSDAPLVLSRPGGPSDRAEDAFEAALASARQSLAHGDAPAAARSVRRARAQPGRSRHPRALELWQELYRRLNLASFNGGWMERTYTGHADWVGATATSADGRRLLSGGGDMTVRLWDTETGECLRVFTGHDDWVGSVALSADGRRALSGGADGTLRLWDAEKGACLHTIPAENFRPRSVAMSPDGSLAASGGEAVGIAIVDGNFAEPGEDQATLRLWDLATGRCVRRFAEVGLVLGVTFSADGRRLATACDKAVSLWEVATGRLLRTFTGHTNYLYAVALSPDGSLAASSGTDKTVRLWDVSTGTCLRVLRGHTERVVSVAFSPDSRWLLSGSWDKTIRLWDADSGTCVRVFEGHGGWVNSVLFGEAGRFLLSASSDKTIRRWDLDWELAGGGPAVATESLP